MSYITKYLAIPLAIMFLFRILILKYKIIIPREFFLVGIWLLFSIISGIFAIDFNVFFDKFLTCLQVMGIAFVLFNLLVWLKNPTLVWSTIFISTLIMSAYVLQYPNLYYTGNRLAGSLGNANLYALALVLSYVYALNRIIASRSIIIKLFFLASIPFILYFIAETGSRKGIVAVVLFAFFAMFLHYNIIIKQSIVIGMAILFVFIALIAMSSYYFFQSKHINRLENAYSVIESGNVSKADDSLKGRLKLYKYGWNIAMEHPVQGVGLDNFRVAMPGGYNSSKRTYSHSNMIELLASTGFIGFAIYYSIYVSIFMKLIKLRGRYSKAWSSESKEIYITTIALILLYFIYDFAMVSYSEKLSWIILSSIFSSTAILENTIA